MCIHPGVPRNGHRSGKIEWKWRPLSQTANQSEALLPVSRMHPVAANGHPGKSKHRRIGKANSSMKVQKESGGLSVSQDVD